MAAEQSERDPIDLLAEDFADKCRRGLTPSIEEYVQKNPQLATQIRELLPTVAMMEQLKARKKAEAIPERIGEFQILREIGRGGMGVVYEAEHKSLGRRVALKVAPTDVLINPVRLERFQREAQAAARLHHTNIVPVFGMGESGGIHYIVMQHIQGCSLNEVLAALRDQKKGATQKVLPNIPKPKTDEYWRWVAQIGVQLAGALSYAHAQGTLHRDIKPANVILDLHGVAWVADFGLAKISGHEELTQTGDIIGTLQYIAPEALQGQGDARSDLYSMALTLYEMVTLRTPFQNMSTFELLRHIGENEPEAPRKINAAVPLDLETIILKGSARNPADRYKNAAEFAEDLRRFCEDLPISARPVSAPERFWRWCRRNKTVAMLSATAVASLLCALVIGWAGYVTTTEALTRESQRRVDADAAKKRAEDNVLMSLQAFEEIFNQLQPADDFAIAEPPPHDGVGQPRPPAEGPPLRFGERPPRLGERPPRFGDGPPPPGEGPPRPGEGPRPPNGPQTNEGPKEKLAMLQSILNFYERFAAKNSTNVNLQFEAAKAYGRVADIHYRLNDDPKAELTLRRALITAERLHADYPENIEYAHLAAQLYSQLGSVLERHNQYEESEQRHRTALGLWQTLAKQNLQRDRFVKALAMQEFALGDFLLRDGRFGEARPLISDAINALLPEADTDPRLGPLISRKYFCLADILDRLGEREASDKARLEGDRLTPRRPRDNRTEDDRHPPRHKPPDPPPPERMRP